jgi:hypothetical protein
MSHESHGIERRMAPRYGCAGDAEIVVPGRGLHYRGTIGDLSVGGCFIVSECRLERGTAVELWMNAQGQPLRVAGNLLDWKQDGAGFRFHSLTARKTEQIRGLIAELAAEAAERAQAGRGGGSSGGDATVATCGGPDRYVAGAGDLAAQGRRWRRWLRRLMRCLVGRLGRGGGMPGPAE